MADEPYTSRILPERIHAGLWERVQQRLEAGEPIYLTAHFQRVLEEEYRVLANEPAGDVLKELFHESVVEYNRKRPEVYLYPGLQNAVGHAFDRGAKILRWNLQQVKAAGPRSIHRFLRRPWTQSLFRSLRITPDAIDPQACLRPVALRLAREVQASLEAQGPQPASAVALTRDAPLARREELRRYLAEPGEESVAAG